MSSDGLRDAVASFQNGIKSGKTAHAYVVVGAPRGEAREFALKALDLLYGVEPGKTLNHETHPDIIWVEPQKKSRIISVEQIREVRRRMSQTAYAGGWKSCIVVGADRLGDDASNAFLKTLEEPSGKSVFFLLTGHPEALLSTVISRCRRVVIGNAHDSVRESVKLELVSILSGSVEGETISGIVPAKKLQVLLEGIKKEVAEEVADSAGPDEDKETREARISARYREIRTAVLRFIMLWHRDILLCVAGADEKCLQNREYAGHIRRVAAAETTSTALMKVGVVETMREQLERNLEEMSVFGTGFCRLVEHS